MAFDPTLFLYRVGLILWNYLVGIYNAGPGETWYGIKVFAWNALMNILGFAWEIIISTPDDGYKFYLKILGLIIGGYLILKWLSGFAYKWLIRIAVIGFVILAVIASVASVREPIVDYAEQGITAFKQILGLAEDVQEAAKTVEELNQMKENPEAYAQKYAEGAATSWWQNNKPSWL